MIKVLDHFKIGHQTAKIQLSGMHSTAEIGIKAEEKVRQNGLF